MKKFFKLNMFKLLIFYHFFANLTRELSVNSENYVQKMTPILGTRLEIFYKFTYNF